jgi:hypothetical protein
MLGKGWVLEASPLFKNRDPLILLIKCLYRDADGLLWCVAEEVSKADRPVAMGTSPRHKDDKSDGRCQHAASAAPRSTCAQARSPSA